MSSSLLVAFYRESPTEGRAYFSEKLPDMPDESVRKLFRDYPEIFVDVVEADRHLVILIKKLSSEDVKKLFRMVEEREAAVAVQHGSAQPIAAQAVAQIAVQLPVVAALPLPAAPAVIQPVVAPAVIAAVIAPPTVVAPAAADKPVAAAAEALPPAPSSSKAKKNKKRARESSHLAEKKRTRVQPQRYDATHVAQTRQYCNLCNKDHINGSDVPFIQCDGCDKWVRISCDRRLASAPQEQIDHWQYFCPQHEGDALRPRQSARIKQRKDSADQRTAAAKKAARPYRASRRERHQRSRSGGNSSSSSSSSSSAAGSSSSSTSTPNEARVRHGTEHSSSEHRREVASTQPRRPTAAPAATSRAVEAPRTAGTKRKIDCLEDEQTQGDDGVPEDGGDDPNDEDYVNEEDTNDVTSNKAAGDATPLRPAQSSLRGWSLACGQRS